MPSEILQNWFDKLAPSHLFASAGSPRTALQQQACSDRASLRAVNQDETGQTAVDAAAGLTDLTRSTGRTDSVNTPARMLLSISRRAMACDFEVLLNQFQYASATDIAVEALDLIQLLETKLSVYQNHSDLSLLNRFGFERVVTVAEDTLTMLALAVDIHQLTDGAFDLTAGSLSETWGFFRRQGQMPSPSHIAEALERSGTQHLQLDTKTRQVRLGRDGVKTNPGGIGKGFALDRAARKLSAAGIGDYLLHGGLSSVLAQGNRQHPETGGGWLISLRHPWRLEELLGSIRLRDQALATSGSGKQFFHFEGKRYSHIIDPRTGWPAGGMMSATVICPSAAVADALATAMFVLGPEASRKLCSLHPAVSAILLFIDDRSGRAQIEVLNARDDLWQPASPYARLA